jgi:hypothetical protein
MAAILRFLRANPKLVWPEDRIEVSCIGEGMVFEGKAGEICRQTGEGG